MKLQYKSITFALLRLFFKWFHSLESTPQQIVILVIFPLVIGFIAYIAALFSGAEGILTVIVASVYGFVLGSAVTIVWNELERLCQAKLKK
jgi:FtsH-binding integral membrane protein